MRVVRATLRGEPIGSIFGITLQNQRLVTKVDAPCVVRHVSTQGSVLGADDRSAWDEAPANGGTAGDTRRPNFSGWCDYKLDSVLRICHTYFMGYTGNRIELAGRRFGTLSVIQRQGFERSPNGNNRYTLWFCRCDCGAEVLARGVKLRKGLRLTCATLQHGSILTWPHIYFYTELTIWRGMRSRCEDPKNKAYFRYGGRGVRVCERWQHFENFISDMGPRPSPLHSIDRFPNRRGNYEPGNCRWATQREQRRNIDDFVNTTVAHGGRQLPLLELVEELGLERGMERVVCKRLKAGWTLERALFLPRASIVAKVEPIKPPRVFAPKIPVDKARKLLEMRLFRARSTRNP